MMTPEPFVGCSCGRPEAEFVPCPVCGEPSCPDCDGAWGKCSFEPVAGDEIRLSSDPNPKPIKRAPRWNVMNVRQLLAEREEKVMTPAEYLALIGEAEKRELVALLVADPETGRMIVDELRRQQTSRALREMAQTSAFPQ